MQNRFYVNESKAKLMLFAHRRDQNSLLSQIPTELISLIMNAPMTAQDVAFDAALKDAAFGRLDELQIKLEANPQLVLGRGSVITPGGLEVEATTILECAIGGGDPEMVAMIKPYFSAFSGGEKELENQLERYRPCIQAMEHQQPYDLTALLEIIRASAPDEVTAALDKKYDPTILLHRTLMQFRKDVKPKTVITAQLHYNYKTLLDAFDRYDAEWEKYDRSKSDNLFKASGNNFNKFHLFWRQVIGYLQRSLPAVDRFAFAKKLNNFVENRAQLVRDTKYHDGSGSYPDLSSNSSDLSGLGFDYGIYNGGPSASCIRRWEVPSFWTGQHSCPIGLDFTKLMSSKNFSLAELIRPTRAHQSIQCVMC